MKPACKWKKKKKSALRGFVVYRFSLYCAAKSDEQVYQGSITSLVGLHSNPSINPDFFFLQNILKLTWMIIVWELKELQPLTEPESHYRVCNVRPLFPVTNQPPSVNIVTFSLKVCCNDILQLLKFSFSLCNSSYNTLFISHLALGNTIQSILWLGWATGVKKQAGAQTTYFYL